MTKSEKNNTILFIIINIFIYILWVCSFLLLYHVMDRGNGLKDIVFIPEIFIPFVILLIYEILSYIYKKLSVYVIKILLNIILFGLVLYSSFVIIAIRTFFEGSQMVNPSPNIQEYPSVIKELKKIYYGHDLNYFPDEIPNNATEYKSDFTMSFQGYDTYYVSFYIDKEYVNELKNKYKNRIIEDNYSNLQEKYYSFKYLKQIINNESDVKFYVIKHIEPDICEDCQYGVAVENMGNSYKIYYYFQNF